LREQVERALAADSKIPDSYFEKLSALQAAQARVTLGRNSKADQAELLRLRADISEFENKTVFQSGKNYFSDENNLRRNSLRSIQARLGREQLLLSFSLGETKSYLWAITGDQVNLYAMAGRGQLENKAALLINAVRHDAGIEDAGQKLSQALFGALPPRLARKPAWLVVADGALLSVPFDALPGPVSGDNGSSLIETHSLRFLPSELLLLSPKRNLAAPRFVGVADPIYNLADSRLNRKAHWDSTVSVEASSVTLARLPGSSQEVRTSAQQTGLLSQQILDGAYASTDNLRKVLDGQPPQLLHFAVHVVSPPDSPQEAALALSLKNDVPELLTPEAIATFRLPGTLVVLSGCSSNQGKAVPSAGLLGLSRAWLLAGADSVIASSWPTPDDAGRFFAIFYSHLHAATSGTLSARAALALAQTQAELKHGRGYTSLPSYWAAYSIISKE
jgi:CHAT domain-containing protein